MKTFRNFDEWQKWDSALWGVRKRARILTKTLKRYRSVVVIATSLLFNLVTSLLVYKPDGVKFNKSPLTVTEWVCEIISIIVFAVGWLMMFYDINRDFKEKIKEALNESMK